MFIRFSFRICPSPGDGNIQPEEWMTGMRKIMSSLGENDYDPSMIDSKAFFEADIDGDGMIDYSEFAGFMYAILERVGSSGDHVEEQLAKVIAEVPVLAEEELPPDIEPLPVLMAFDPVPVCKFKEFLHPHQKGKTTDGWEQKTNLIMDEKIIHSARGRDFFFRTDVLK